MFNANIIEDVLSKEDCSYLIDTVKNIEPWQDGGSDFWNNRSLNGEHLYNNFDKKAGLILYNLRFTIAQHIKTFYKEDQIFPDLTQIVRWFPGMEQSPHCDDMTNYDVPEMAEFKTRNYGAILYLNDDYFGGKTYYPNYNFEITPKAGMLAIHPGDPDHLHGVTKIENSTRYTIASFWTKSSNKFDGWTI